MKIPLIKSTFYNDKDTKDKLCEFIQSAERFSLDSECRKFEENFSNFQEREYSTFVTSGSSANLLLVQALLNMGKLKKGDRVGVSALTWSTNIMPVIQLGLEPILIDCEIDSVNVSSRKVKEKSIDALFLTNALGFSSDIDNIEDYCNEEKILFLEDNCESLGTEYKGKLLGNFGLASTFSFYVGHHLSTIEGGMVCTNNEELYHNLLISRIHGWGRNLPKEKNDLLKKEHGANDFYEKYLFYDLAFNVRPTEIAGFLGNLQIKYLNEMIDKRESNFKTLNEIISKNPEIIPLNLEGLTKISNFGVPLTFKKKEYFEKYKKRFEENEVEIRPIISGNMVDQPFFKKYFPNQGPFPNASFIHENGFYCGNNPEMNPEEINFIKELLKYEKRN